MKTAPQTETVPSQRQVHPWKRDREKSRRELRDLLIRAQGAKCASCNVHMRLGKSGRQHARRATLDHVIPVAKGGTNHFGNFVLLCRACNEAKADNANTELVAFSKRLWARIDAEGVPS